MRAPHPSRAAEAVRALAWVGIVLGAATILPRLALGLWLALLGGSGP